MIRTKVCIPSAASTRFPRRIPNQPNCCSSESLSWPNRHVSQVLVGPPIQASSGEMLSAPLVLAAPPPCSRHPLQMGEQAPRTTASSGYPAPSWTWAGASRPRPSTSPKRCNTGRWTGSIGGKSTAARESRRPDDEEYGPRETWASSEWFGLGIGFCVYSLEGRKPLIPKNEHAGVFHAPG
jgi:hypothetical protein